MLFFSHAYRLDVLRDQCSWGEIYHPCKNGSDYCIWDTDFCNGIANCPDGGDEDLEFCNERATFSSLATIDCKKKGVYNLDIVIKAVKCDNKVECENNEDENDCSLPDSLLLEIVAIVVVFTSISALIMWKLTKSQYKPCEKYEELSEDDFEKLHGTDALRPKMQRIQHSADHKTYLKRYILMEMNLHLGIESETICCIKVSISPTLCFRTLKREIFCFRIL